MGTALSSESGGGLGETLAVWAGLRVPPGRPKSRIPPSAKLTIHELESALDWAATGGSICERLVAHAQRTPDKVAFYWLNDSGNQADSITFSELVRRAQALAAMMKGRWGIRRNALVLLVFPPSIDFIVAITACLMGGFVAVPVYPPDPGNPRPGLAKLAGAVKTTHVKVVLSNTQFLRARRFIIGASSFPANLRWRDVGKAVTGARASILPAPRFHSQALAFVQFSSGSTGDPKGVAVTHGNLNANVMSISRTLGSHVDTVGVTWVPFYHDMGLVGSIMHTIFVGCQGVLMSPTSFLRDPFVWLKAISDYRGTMTCAPNFAYELAVRKITPRKRDMLDLTSCHRYSNGAEPVRYMTLQRFAKAFAQCGFRMEYWDAMLGIAENVVLVSAHHGEQEPTVITIKRGAANAVGERFELAGPEDEEGVELVANGTAGVGIKLVIAHPDTRHLLTEGRIGEIWLAGPSKVCEYYGRPHLSREALNAELSPPDGLTYLRTGDLGFVQYGEVFVCGRIKDMLIVRGRNLFPQDLERSAEEAAPNEIRAGCVAAFCPSDTEDVVIVAELRDDAPGPSRARISLARTRKSVSRQMGRNRAEIAGAVRARIATEHSVSPENVVLIESRSIPKTTSGKIRRKATREAYEHGELKVVHALVGNNDGSGSRARIDAKSSMSGPVDSDLAALDAFMGRIEALQLVSDPAEMRALCQSFGLAEAPALMAQPVFAALVSQPCALNETLDAVRDQLADSPRLRSVAAAALRGYGVATHSMAVAFARRALSVMLLLHTFMEPTMATLFDRTKESPWYDHVWPIVEKRVANRYSTGTGDWFRVVKIGLLSTSAKSAARMNVDALPDPDGAVVDALRANVMAAVMEELIVRRGDVNENARLGMALCGAIEDIGRRSASGPSVRVAVDVYLAWNASFVMSMGLGTPETDLVLAILFCPAVVRSQTLEELASSRCVTLLLALAVDEMPPGFAVTGAGDEQQQAAAVTELRPLTARMVDSLADPDSERATALLFPRKFIKESRRDADSMVMHAQPFCALQPTWSDSQLARRSLQLYRLWDDVWEEARLGMRARGHTRPDGNDDKNDDDDLPELPQDASPEQEEAWLLAICRLLLGAPDLRTDDDIFDAGLTSLQMVELQTKLDPLAGDEGVDADVLASCRTVRALAVELRALRGRANLEPLRQNRSRSLPGPIVDLLQLIGVLGVFAAMGAAVLPAYYFGKFVQFDDGGLPEPLGGFPLTDSLRMFGLAVPLVIPIWLLAFTAEFIVLKWFVVGRYRPQEVRLGSLAYLRWWFVDRLAHIWETTAGSLIVDTPLLPIAYKLLGANIYWAQDLGVLFREWDLVSVGPGSKISGTLVPRLFDAQERTLRFRRITVGAGCETRTRSVLMPGAVLQDGAVADVLEVVGEGQLVVGEAHGVTEDGEAALKRRVSPPTSNSLSVSPAEYSVDDDASEPPSRRWRPPSHCTGLAKLLTRGGFMFFNLYAVFYMSTAGLLLWDFLQPAFFRYLPLVYWVSSFFITSALALVYAIALKWVLLGRRRPGPVRGSFYEAWAEWAADFAYKIPYRAVFIVFDEMRLAVNVQRALGARIGHNVVFSDSSFLLPSNADMFSMGPRGSLAACSLRTVDNGVRGRVRLLGDNEVGIGAVLGADTLVEKLASVGALTHLRPGEIVESGTRRLGKAAFQVEFNDKDPIWGWLEELWVLLTRLVFLVAVPASLIPAYEFATWTLFGGADQWPLPTAEAPVSRDVAVVLLGGALLLAMLGFAVLEWIITRLALGFGQGVAERPCRMSTYMTFQALNFVLSELLLPVTHGTVFYKVYLRCFGASVGTSVVALSKTIRDKQLLRMDAGCIVDAGAYLGGHQFTGGKLLLRPSAVGAGATMHPQGVALGGAVVPAGGVLRPLQVARHNI